MKAEAVVGRARALIGVRFRPQGRSREEGLDCIGVAAVAAGVPVSRVRRDYRLRSRNRDRLESELGALGFRRFAPAEAEPGDLLLARAGPAQLHLVILTPAGFVHADVRLRRVVEVPGPVPWPALSAWRHSDLARRPRNPMKEASWRPLS